MSQQTMVIPEELLEQIERGNVLLFVGEQLNQGEAGQSFPEQLRIALLARLNYPDNSDDAFPVLAEEYENDHGRQALVQFIRDQFEAVGDQPQQVHDLIAGLTQCQVLVTTTLSRHLEHAFSATQRPLQVIINDTDVAYEEAQRTQLYKLRGTLDRPESLVLTERDHEEFFDADTSLSVVLKGYLARKTILFLGYDVDNLYFKRLYRKVTAALDNHARRAYTFGIAPSSTAAKWCQRNNINVVGVSTANFLVALNDSLATRSRPKAQPVLSVTSGKPLVLPEQPYKLLDYYESTDAGIFFGREHEIQELTALIHAHRLTVVYGASGVGKTSLLLAGVSPRLADAEQGYETIYARALEDPSEVIRRTVRLQIHETTLPTHGTLVDFLVAATRALGRPLVVVLDQFEEFFIRLSPQFRDAFIADLVAIYETRNLPVKIVLSLREDWLAAVSEIERRIPGIFNNRMRVLPLSREQAKDAIVRPVAKLGVSYEPALIESLLNDLTNGTNGDVMPPQIQLVCNALYKRLPQGERTITMQSYTRLGTARGVLQQYLEDELARLSRDDRAIARSALTELVTSQGTKAVKSVPELALGLDVAETTLLPVLELLTRARLLRVIEHEDAPPSYELAHEYLIREIELEADAKTRKQAEELIRQEVDNWQRFGTLLAADKLALVNDVRATLRLNPLAQELMLRSALDVGEEVPYWLDRMTDADQRARVLADKARTRVGAVRQRVATVLGTQDVPESIEPLLTLALNDHESKVRSAAQHALAQLITQRHVIIDRLHEFAKSGDRTKRRIALETLALLPIRDVPPGLRAPTVVAGTRVKTTHAVQTSIATPAGRATATITSALLLVAVAAVLFSYSSYYIVTNPSGNGESNATILIRRGQPPLKLPGIDQAIINTGIPEAAIDKSARARVANGLPWGMWLRTTDDQYAQWGDQVADVLLPEDKARWWWYLDQDERTVEVLVQVLQGFVLVNSGNDADSPVRSRVANALGQVVAAKPEVATSQVVDALVALLASPGDDPGGYVQSSAANALVEVVAANPDMRDRAMKNLLPLLEAQENNVRSTTVSTLARLFVMQHQESTQPSELFAMLVDPLDALKRPVAARALFLIVLNNPVNTDIRTELQELAESREPISRIWANKTLAMLDLADSAQETNTKQAAERTVGKAKLQAYQRADFFGEDFTWAASEAFNWVAQQDPVDQ